MEIDSLSKVKKSSSDYYLKILLYLAEKIYHDDLFNIGEKLKKAGTKYTGLQTGNTSYYFASGDFIMV